MENNLKKFKWIKNESERMTKMMGQQHIQAKFKLRKREINTD